MESIGVECLARSNHAVPPAEAFAAAGVALVGAEAVARAAGNRSRRVARRVRVAAERVADQNHVVTRRGERAVGLVGDPDGIQLTSALERERLRKLQKLRLDRAD